MAFQVDEVIMGRVLTAGARAKTLPARLTIKDNLPFAVPALTTDKVCGSRPQGHT